ncbi:hypothetical protein MPH_01889 [Macrophomina phaseolina MS6]|uniref:Uncharacterized protein n=1 Tax=Macrophomina phaseolina (strain MS6) TaxID=1126212 RepID=K2SW54_MACPH|nr:hypothetical protein MPH_01889 [Macrophomina phaseolina MS6]
MLLVTPSFAAALRAPSNGGAPEAIGKAISRLLTHSLNYSSPLRNVRVVAAVVDKLPAPANNQDTGKVCEGLAYAMWFSDNVTRKNWTKRSTLEQDDTVGRLTFDIWDRFRLTDTDGQPRRDFYDTIHRLHLPLANTIFQTGQTSIMWNILYRVNETEEYQDGVALEEPRSLYADKVNDVKYQRVTWPLCGRYLAHEKKFFPAPNRTLHLLQVPLVPLTAARRIHASMGNIIRQISGHNEQPAPASQELEKAVSSYFEVTNQVPHSMPVWAMVFNERAVKYFSSAVLGVLGKQQPEKFSKSYDYAGVLSEYIQEAWRIDPKFFQFAIWKGLLRGNAKIHRVLSGGGGWGKKAGLISLDPRRYFEQSPRSASSSLDADGHESHADALGRVAIPGSYIQFFASPALSLESPQYARDTSVFGTIPSSIDDIPQAGEGPAEIEVWPGWFGALSEQGMSMKYVVHEHQTHATEHFSQTMIDVPFSLFVTNSHLPGAKPQGSAAEDAKEVELKPSTYSATNAKTASGLGPSERQGRRSLHSNAQVSFIQLSRRSFSAGSVHRLKSDYLERLTRQWKRPMVPLSRRLREVEVAEGFSIRNIREDLLMTLPKYKRMRDFLHRLAATCQAESDRRPVPPKPRSRKGPAQLAGELWARRARDCRTKVDELRQGSIKLLEAQLDVSNWQLNFWASCVRNLEKGKPLYGCKVNGELVPLRNRKLKILRRAIAAEQRRVAPLPFRASEVVDILDELVNNSRVKCKRAEDMVYKAVVKRRKKLIKARRARAAADGKIQEDKANSGKSYKSTKLFVFNREVVVDNQWMVVPLPVASYRLRGHQRFLTKALEKQVKVIRESGREKLEALQDNKTRVRVPEEVALDKSAMGIAELERVAGTVSGPGVTRDRPESSATWMKELKEPFETAREVVPGSPESSATWVKELKEPFETAKEVVPGSPESGRPTLTYRSRPIPASRYVRQRHLPPGRPPSKTLTRLPLQAITRQRRRRRRRLVRDVALPLYARAAHASRVCAQARPPPLPAPPHTPLTAPPRPRRARLP